MIKVFVTMLVLKDSEHVYYGNVYNLSRQSRKSQEEVMQALQVLSSPDRLRSDKQDDGGRRIKAVEDGWEIVNGQKYRELISKEMKLARDRKAKQAQRLRDKMNPPRRGRPLAGELAAIKAMKNGNQKLADDIAARPVHRKSAEDGADCPEPLN